MTDNNQEEKPGKTGSGQKIVSVLVVLMVVAITVGLFLFRDRVSELGNYGYLGAFLISLIGNATIILPVPTFMLVIAFGASFNPFLVGITSAIGGTIGEMTCYLLGFSGRMAVENKKLYDKAVHWLGKWGALTVFVFALTPSPFDVIGIVAGLLRYPFWKFFLASLAGKTIKYIVLALAGAWGWEVITGGMNTITTVVLSAVGVIVILVASLFLEDWTWKREQSR
ncbi:YqaA family protein [Chloroflexota bacterium]